MNLDQDVLGLTVFIGACFALLGCVYDAASELFIAKKAPEEVKSELIESGDL